LIEQKVIIHPDFSVTATPLETVCPASGLFSSTDNQSAGSSLRTFSMGLLVLAWVVNGTPAGQQAGLFYREIS
jgi:hypothetical protein